jgi:hypothetical protein
VARALRALNASVGAAMVLIGLALPYAAFIDTGHAPGTDAFRLIQFHFMLTGAVSLWASAARARAALSAVLLVLAPLNIAMAPISYFAGGESRLWLLLFVPAGLSAFILFLIDGQSKLTADVAALDAPLDDLPAPDYAARPVEQGDAAGAVANAILVMAFGSVLAFAGGVYLDLVLAAMIYREPIDLAAAFSGAESGAFARLFEKLRIEIVSIVIGFAFLGAFGAIWSGMLRNRIDAVAPDFDRALSQRERVHLRDAYQALAARFGEAAPSSRQQFYGVLATLALSALPFVLMLSAFGAEARLLDKIGARRADVPDFVAYEGGPLIASSVLGFAALPILFGVLQFAGARWPAFGCRLYVHVGWNNFALFNRRSAPSLIYEAARQVRRRSIATERPFDIDEFITAAIREFQSLYYKTALAAAGAVCFLFAADLAFYRLATTDAVAYSNYGVFVEGRVPIDEIDRVELGCAIVDPGEPYERVKLRYVLVEEGAFRFDLLDDRRLAEGHFSAVEALDQRLADAGVTFFLAARDDNSLFSTGPGYIDDCNERITARYEPDIAARLIRLLRADAPAP